MIVYIVQMEKSKTADTDARAGRARYQEAVDKMTEMVKAGEITQEQMQIIRIQCRLTPT